MLIRNKFNGYAADGRRIYNLDSGGGSSTPQSTTTTTDLPEWARGYAQEALARGQALSSKPYETYGADRIAGFSPLQLQAQQRIAGMGPAGQIGEASDIASLAGARAFQAGQYQPGQFQGGTFTPGAAGFYMSPFMEQALAPQLREAQRQSDILGTQQAGQAVQAGAFGGSRAGLLEAERQRNLGMQMGDIRARGYQTAYEQAANQFNQDMQRRMQAQQLGEQSRQFGAGLGIQGLSTALQAANQLGALGQAQFGQEKDVIGMQREAGAEQQRLQQQGLTQAYQDFLNQQNYPYKQLGFFSDLIRGLPLGQQSTQQVYAATPSPLQTIGSLGLGAYGLKQAGIFAEGGSVTDDAFVEAALDKMSDTQLAEAERAAIMRNDTKRLEQIAEEKAVRASERRGLAGAFNQIPQDQQQQMVQAARGGILAFAKGGDEGEEDFGGDNFGLQGLSSAPGAPEYYRDLAEGTTVPTMTPEERAAAMTAARQGLAQQYGSGVLTPFIKDIATQREALTGRREENKGLIALAAAQALSRAPGLRAGLGEMFGAIGTEASKLNKDIRESERLIRQSELHLQQAQQAREDRLTDLSSALVDKAQAEKQAAAKLRKDVNLKLADISSRERQAGLSREQAERLGKARIDATLEAAKIGASRLGETTATIREATEAYTAAGMTPEEAKVKAVETVVGRGSVTDWSRLQAFYVEQALADDPQLKNDPVRLAKVKADAGDKAAATLKGYDARAALERQKLRLQAEEKAMGNSEYLRAGRVLADPKATDEQKAAARSARERVISDLMGEPSAPASAPAPRTPTAMSDTEKTAAREWLKNNPNDPRAARVRAALGE